MHGLLMRARRRQLSVRLLPFRGTLPEMPKRGWLRAIREPLGMSLEAFGAKLGLTTQAAQRLETSEANGSISLNRLRQAADVLGCEVAVVLVPREDLEKWVEGLAQESAKRLFGVPAPGHLEEGTPISAEVLNDLVRREAARMIELNDPRIWG